jgi:cytochrome c556
MPIDAVGATPSPAPTQAPGATEDNSSAATDAVMERFIFNQFQRQQSVFRRACDKLRYSRKNGDPDDVEGD